MVGDSSNSISGVTRKHCKRPVLCRLDWVLISFQCSLKQVKYVIRRRAQGEAPAVRVRDHLSMTLCRMGGVSLLLFDLRTQSGRSPDVLPFSRQLDGEGAQGLGHRHISHRQSSLVLTGQHTGQDLRKDAGFPGMRRDEVYKRNTAIGATRRSIVPLTFTGI